MEGRDGGEGIWFDTYLGDWNYQNLVIDWMPGMREGQDTDDCWVTGEAVLDTDEQMGTCRVMNLLVIPGSSFESSSINTYFKVEYTSKMIAFSFKT